MNVMWLNSDKAGCGTYRCYIPALSLQERGYDNFFLEHKRVRDSRLSAEVETVNVVVFQRAVGSLFLDWIHACHARGIGTIFEMDDDLFGVPRHNPSHGYWGLKGIRKILHKILETVDVIIVSTIPLRERLLALGYPHERIVVCHNHLHPGVWDQAYRSGVKVENHHLTVIGWQGSSTHDVDFKEALPALVRIVRERADVMVRFFGNVPLTIRGHLPETRFQWTPGVEFDRYPAALRYVNFDIGLAPITDSKFNRGKSNLKWMEYSVLSLPTVASRVYPYEQSIRHGETGFLATTEEEWYTALTALLDDPTLRERVGAQARAEVLARWYPHCHIAAWERALALAAGSRCAVVPGLGESAAS